MDANGVRPPHETAVSTTDQLRPACPLRADPGRFWKHHSSAGTRTIRYTETYVPEAPRTLDTAPIPHEPRPEEHMSPIMANGDGSIGPFAEPVVAKEWITARLELLSSLAGQRGAPTVEFLETARESDPWSTCTCPAIYDSATDTVLLDSDTQQHIVLDIAAVDGMLLHVLGHRAQRTRIRVLQRAGWALLSAGLAVGFAATLHDGFRSGFASPLLWLATLIVGVGAIYGVIAARSYWRLEADADEFALRHGGPQPILTLLQRLSVDTPLPSFKPTRRIARLQSLIGTASPRSDEEASTFPPVPP